MLQPYLEDMLDEEIVSCSHTGVLEHADAALWREGTSLYLSFPRGRDGKQGLFRLDCARFDAEPISVGMVDPATRAELAIDEWTPGVPHSVHPLSGKAFICLQGVAEYHTHPSHLGDSWDRYRYVYRVPQLVRRLLEKAGAAGDA